MTETVVVHVYAFGMTHPTWDRPSNFFYLTAERAQDAIERVYGPNSGHLVVERRFYSTPPGEES